MRTFLTMSLLLALQSIMSQKTMIIAHRGASAYKPENTLSAFKLAFEMKADAIELDIWKTADNKIIVNHDHNTKRVADKNMVVYESSAADLQAINVNGGEKLPLLEEVFALVPKGKKIVIEIKCDGKDGRGGSAFPELAQVVEQSGRKNDCIFISFSKQSIIEAKANLPKNQTYLLSSEKNAAHQLISFAKEHKLTGLDVSHGILTDELVEKANAKEMPLIIWTIDNPTVAVDAVLNKKVYGVTTNKPDLIRKELELAKKRPL